MIDKIQKRNGDVVAFDSMKIMNAIDRANKAVEGETMTPTDLLFLTENILFGQGFHALYIISRSRTVFSLPRRLTFNSA